DEERAAARRAKKAKENDEEEGDDEEEEEEEEEEDDEEEEEEDSSDLDLGAKVAVVVDGKEEEVTLEEALNGYIRTQTFHTRMNQLNEIRGAVRDKAIS